MMTNSHVNTADVIIIGAGAAGLMCAIRAGSKKRQVVVLDHANKVGKKILMSGGGRCNFTNYYVSDENFISNNPHFCKSALSRYTPWHFIEMVEKHQIPYHEKKLGQLFCDNKSKDILNMLLTECEKQQVKVNTHCEIQSIEKTSTHFFIQTSQGKWQCESLVVATGGLSIPTMGATGFGYKIAKQFGLAVYPQKAGLVPFTLQPNLLSLFDGLSGSSADVVAQCGNHSFRENLLLTHRGLSGPAILQASSYWSNSENVQIDWCPDIQLFDYLKSMQQKKPQAQLNTILSQLFTKKLAERFCQHWFAEFFQKPIIQLSHHTLNKISNSLHHWCFIPSGTEGYRTAEVTLGGVDTDEISSKTFQSNKVSGLYFIGEVLDVTGHLGGFNFQWAWASGHAAGECV